MKIAIIGSGISGLTAAYYLHPDHDITLFEANDYIGGHTATVNVTLEGKEYAVDTGFIVYNDRTYPNFIRLMDELGVKRRPTEMSFSVRNDGNGLEYNGHSLLTLFAQKRNLFRPSFYRFIGEIMRFNQLAKEAAKSHSRYSTLGEFLQKHRFSADFCENYILPMGAAIWSSTMADMRQFPLDFFLRFFLNHGLLDVLNRPQWYVIDGGSSNYIPALTEKFADKIRLNSEVTRVIRGQLGVEVVSKGVKERFDDVIFACHSNQALAMLSDATDEERSLLSAIRYQPNDVVLHTDVDLLPRHKSAWAAWNYWLNGSPEEASALPAVTYNMNILQHIRAPHTFCVTLNNSERIDPSKILRRFVYDHPVFSVEAIAAQSKRDVINGRHHTWFCGAYWYNGFHEDGVRSALDVVALIEEKYADNINRGAA